MRHALFQQSQHRLFWVFHKHRPTAVLIDEMSEPLSTINVSILSYSVEGFVLCRAPMLRQAFIVLPQFVNEQVAIAKPSFHTSENPAFESLFERRLHFLRVRYNAPMCNHHWKRRLQPTPVQFQSLLFLIPLLVPFSFDHLLLYHLLSLCVPFCVCLNFGVSVSGLRRQRRVPRVCVVFLPSNPLFAVLARVCATRQN